MGAIEAGVPKRLVDYLREVYELDCFVETGTYAGDTADWASTVFSRVITIEASEVLFESARQRLTSRTNVQCIHGDSRTKLRTVVTELSGGAIYWLDAHWSGGLTSGSGDECPLLDELSIVAVSNSRNIILIDDARLFLAPPPKPHDAGQWPSLSDICSLVLSRHYGIYVYRDVIILIPIDEPGMLVRFLQEEATEAEQLRRRGIGRRLSSRLRGVLYRREASR